MDFIDGRFQNSKNNWGCGYVLIIGIRNIYMSHNYGGYSIHSRATHILETAKSPLFGRGVARETRMILYT